jgi:hypothetical protein
VLSDDDLGRGKDLELLSEREMTELHMLHTDSKLLLEDFHKLLKELCFTLDPSSLLSCRGKVMERGVNCRAKVVELLEIC